jgi:quinol monooxygenase YgiN
MPVFMTAHFTVKPESRLKCEQAIQAFIDGIKASEPGTVRYTSLQRADDPNSFMHFFVFADAGARETHANSENTRRFTDLLYPELVAPVTFTEYTMFAST